MIENIATVVAIEGHTRQGQQRLLLSTAVKSGCNGCEANSHCGTGMLAKAFGERLQQFHANSSIALEPGQRVRIGIPEATLLGLAALMYGLPLVILIASAVLASMLFVAEWPVILVSLSTTGLCLVALRHFLRHWDNDRFAPQILGVLLDEKATSSSR